MRLLCVLLMAGIALKAQDEREAALGAHLAKEIGDRTKPLDSEAALHFVERLGARLAAQFPGLPWAVKFGVVTGEQTSRTHEPVALPGGYVFVPAELLPAAESEAEFAGMLAHAIAHVA